MKTLGHKRNLAAQIENALKSPDGLERSMLMKVLTEFEKDIERCETDRIFIGRSHQLWGQLNQGLNCDNGFVNYGGKLYEAERNDSGHYTLWSRKTIDIVKLENP